MPRTVDAALKAALESGVFIPYFKAVYYVSGIEVERDIKGYKLTGTALEVDTLDFAGSAFPAYLVLKRGVMLDGAPNYIATSKFYISSQLLSMYQGTRKVTKVKASLFPENRISLVGDVSYQTIITAFCTAYGKTAVFENPGAAHWGYQFLPTGKYVILNNAMQFLNLLAQKYFIFCCDIGGEEVLFYHGMANRDADYQYTIRYEGPGVAGDIITHNVIERTLQPLDQRAYIARDENETVRNGGTADRPLHNLGFLKSTDSFPALSTQALLFRAVMAVNLTPQSGDIVRLDPSWIARFAYPVEVTEELNTGLKEIPWRTTIETRRVFENTAGGALPSTIERVSNYTPLGTGNFNKVLSASDNNLQAAMETIDEHQHKGMMMLSTHGAGGTVPAGLTYYLCPFYDGLVTVDRAQAVTRAGTLKNFYFRAAGVQPASGSLVATVRKNSVNTAITVTVPPGGSLTYTDLVHTVSVAPGDFVSVEVRNNATAASVPVGFVTLEYEYSTG